MFKSLTTGLISTVLFASLFAEDGKCNASFDGKLLNIQIGNMKVSFIEKDSWTLHRAFYNSKDWLVPSGFMQSVLYEDFPDSQDKKMDHFLGAGHRHEKVDSVSVTFFKGGKDLKKMKTEAPFSVIENADAATVEKHSKFISEIGGFLLEHQSKVTVSADSIKEDFYYKGGDGILGKVKFMYPFMHIFPNSTKYWLAGDDNGDIIEEGLFKDDGSFTLNKPIRWTFIYDPGKETGTIYCYPETYTGINKLWNRSYDNKLYFMSDCVKKNGDEKSLSVSVYPFSALEKDWRKKAGELLFVKTGIKFVDKKIDANVQK